MINDGIPYDIIEIISSEIKPRHDACRYDVVTIRSILIVICSSIERI
jgi:hypothetical protein